jgi:large subunit ribosomal protein L25
MLVVNVVTAPTAEDLEGEGAGEAAEEGAAAEGEAAEGAEGEADEAPAEDAD